MRQRLTETIHKLRIQLHKIERASTELEARDKSLYEKCIEAVKQGDFSRAKIYAEECAQIRKIAKITLNSQFALERVVLRLEAVREFGDIAHNVAPVKSVVGSVRSGLSQVMPDVSLKLAEIDESLASTILDVGEATGGIRTPDQPSEEARKILDEAAAFAEQQVKEKFPELPSTTSEETTFRPL
jgi:division protein CdvB (Snf7/Vps24/ESCRT-III family)